MDNLCHTLVGAALAESGLKRRTAMGAATLMIAANFPDIDVVAVPLGTSLGFRRGITHGLPAQMLLPFVLTALIIGWHRWRGRGEAPLPREVLWLSFLGILSHPVLDWMNSYGMRWLMPFSGRWWYGDSLFIVDPWILLALLAGVWLTRRRVKAGHSAGTRPARAALGVVAAYIAAMVMLSRHTRDRARAQLAARGITPDTVVVDPQFATPVTRGVTYLWQGSYHLATFHVFGGGLSEPWAEIAVQGDHPAIDLANATPAGRQYHSWARLPYYVVEESRDTTWVFIGDARYTLNAHGSWATVRIPVVRQADRVPGQ